MEYEGKLYGKVGSIYFPLIETTQSVKLKKSRSIEKAKKKAVEKVLNELQLKLIGMQTFASESYNEIAYEGAVTVFDEIRAWIKQQKEAQL